MRALAFKTETEGNIKSLQVRKKGLEDQIKGLDKTISLKSEEIRSLEVKKERYEARAGTRGLERILKYSQ